MTPCSLLSCNRRFEGTYRLPPAYLLVLAELFLRPWRWRRYAPLKRQLQLNRLNGVISQKLILFITTAVETSDPTRWHYIPILKSRDSSVGTATSYRLDYRESVPWFSAGERGFSLLESVQTGPGAHATSYSVLWRARCRSTVNSGDVCIQPLLRQLNNRRN
jgi:hypothetical protein